MRTLRPLQLLLALWLTLTSVVSGSCLALSSPQVNAGVAQSSVSLISKQSANPCCCPDPAKMQREMPCCAEPKTMHDSATSVSLPSAHSSQLKQTGCGCAFTPQSPTRGPTQEKTRFLTVEALSFVQSSTLFMSSLSAEVQIDCTSDLYLYRTAFSLLPSRAPPVLA